MTLEDFFTLTEMKDGLTAPARVKELIHVMQKERDCIVKNVGDATRQWSTVASTIAATEDKDCLDLFIQLEGLWFIDRWLKDAQKIGNVTSESLEEESITALLCALEKLRLDCNKLVSSGVWMTVKDLLGHTNSRVQDRARALLDSCKQEGNSETGPNYFEKEVGNEENHAEPVQDENLSSSCSGNFQQEKVDDFHIQTSKKENTLYHQVLKDKDSPDPLGSSIVLKPLKKNSLVEEESPFCHLEGTVSVETYTSVVPNQQIEEKSDVPNSNESDGEAKKVLKVTSPLNNSGTMEISSVSLLGDVTANAQDIVTDWDLENNVDNNDKGCPKVSPDGDVELDLSEGKSRMDDAGSPPHHCRSMLIFFSSEDSGSINNIKEHDSDDSDDMSFDSNFSKPAIDVKVPDVIIAKSRSDLDLDDVMVDALEVARQVAIEVEREVVDRSREPSCSNSSEITSKNCGIRQTDSPECIYDKESQPFDASSQKEAPTRLDPSTVSLPNEEELLSSANPLDAETGDQNKDINSSEATEVSVQKEPEVNMWKGFCGFDLNQEVFSEDMVERPIIPNSATISVVSASRAVAAPWLPESPLQFEGTLGWKGSSATSAFRRIMEDGKGHVANGGAPSSSKQRQAWPLDFDLNVAEAASVENRAADHIHFKRTEIISSGLLFGESSVEASRKRHEKWFNLDLNHVSDDGDAPSPSSSSSSMHPTLRNIDLNDQPSSFHNDSSSDLLQPFYLSKPCSQNLNSSEGVRSHDSVISILGTRVEVNPPNFVTQTPPLQNGRNVNPALDFSLGNSEGVVGMMGGCTFPDMGPVLGHNVLAGRPGVTFSSTMYGGSHYMVDSRGATVVPQALGYGSSSLVAHSHPQFVVGMTLPGGSNGTVPLRPHFDLFEGGNNMESSSRSGGVGKRKEPDGGWEPPYPFNYRPPQHLPWK